MDDLIIDEVDSNCPLCGGETEKHFISIKIKGFDQIVKVAEIHCTDELCRHYYLPCENDNKLDEVTYGKEWEVL